MLTMTRAAAFAALAVTIIGVGCAPACAATVEYTANMSGPSEVPPANSRANGRLSATYDTVSRKLSWTINYSSLSGPPTMAHFHGPASPKTSAPVLIAIPGSLNSPIKGEATLSEAQAQTLSDGRMYVNIRTEQFAGGEIRGQMENAYQ